MKRVFKWLGIVLGALAGIVIIVAAVVYIVSDHRIGRRYEVQVVSVQVPAGAAVVAEGQRLFQARGCIDCHGDNLAGKGFVDDPAIGRYSGANLTKGVGGVGGNLTDGDIARAIREGIAPDGRALVFMPSTDFHGMSDGDAGHLIAYIRSAAPVDRTPLHAIVGPLARVLYLSGNMPVLVSAEVIDHKAPRAAAPPVGATVEYGKYLAQGCTGCHGTGFSGGTIQGGPPDWPPARNLTSDTATGLGKWSYVDFEKATRHGITPAGTQLRPPMPWANLSHMTDTEVKALWSFFQQVPPRPEGNH